MNIIFSFSLFSLTMERKILTMVKLGLVKHLNSFSPGLWRKRWESNCVEICEYAVIIRKQR